MWAGNLCISIKEINWNPSRFRPWAGSFISVEKLIFGLVIYSADPCFCSMSRKGDVRGQARISLPRPTSTPAIIGSLTAVTSRLSTLIQQISRTKVASTRLHGSPWDISHPSITSSFLDVIPTPQALIWTVEQRGKRGDLEGVWSVLQAHIRVSTGDRAGPALLVS